MSDQQSPGLPDIGGLLGQAQQMMQAQAEAAEAIIEGTAGGGAVKIEVTGSLDFRSVTIDPSAVDPDDVEVLQDLVLAALHHAMSQITEQQESAMGGLDLGGLDLGSLLGGLGGGE